MEVVRLKNQLISYSKKMVDKVTKIKLREAIKQMDKKFGSPVMKDDHFLSLMRYYELAKEVRKCLKKA